MRHVPSRARWIPALIAVAALALPACGSAQIAAGAGQQPRITSIDPYGGEPAAEGEPEPGGTARIGMDREVVSFDTTVQNSNAAAFAVYDTLLRIAPDGSAQPYLARSMDSPDDGRTWRLGLRDGVVFTDGTPLDAEAVRINIQRHIDTVTSPAHALAMRITSMRVVDPLTLEIALDEPFGAFPVMFGTPISTGSLGVIISPAALQQYGADIGSHPVGAGPFRFVEWIRDSRIVLERNPNYWQPGLPHLDRLEFRPLSDTESRYASIQNGDVDLIYGAYNEELVRAVQNPELRVYYGEQNGGELLYFNFARPPFDDRRMREAVVRAIDRSALSAVHYSSQIVPADSLFASGSPNHDAAASQLWPTYDPERARQLVAEYAADGGSTEIEFKTVTTWLDFAQFIQAELAAVGITVKVEVYDLAQYAAQVVQSGDFDLSTTVSSFDSPYPGPVRLLDTTGNQNYGKYTNPRVDQLLDLGARTLDEGERTVAYKEVEKIVNQDVVFCWLSRGFLSTITRPEVKGVVRYPSRDMHYATLWMDR
ncbi:ABC transporter substrate-binding protein [Pseudonocardia sp. DLS-67]